MSETATATVRSSPLRSLQEEAGARFQELRGAAVPRHFGDPAAEYEAATGGLAVLDRSHRLRLRVFGRAPERMLDGIVTCAVPGAPERVSDEVAAGAGSYGAVLTPKGKVVTDLRLLPWYPGEADDDGEAFLLDVPAAADAGLRSHLDKYLPPRFAERRDVSGESGMLTFLGPEAARILARDVAGLRVGEEELEALDEDAFVRVGSSPGDGIHIVRCGSVPGPAFDVLADPATIRALWERLAGDAARPVGYGTWETLRVERGRPAFGTDMDDATIPVEAGIHRRAIDYEKGCYTGQEVVVRIRDRGRVNWHLRGLLMGDVATPAAETPLHEPGEEKQVGRVTSAVHSPRFGEVAGLGYVRREVEPPATLRLGGPDGSEVRVREVGDDGWEDG